MKKKGKGAKKNKGSKGSRRGGGSRNQNQGSVNATATQAMTVTTESGFEFPIPPRKSQAIIGRVRPDMRPRKKQIEELYYSLKYEIDSDERKALVEHQRKVVINEENDDLGICKKDDILKTYETKEMTAIGTITPLLFGLTKRRPFLFSRMKCPPQDVICLRDKDLGESDRMVHWNGDCILVMEFKGLFPCVFIGECYLTKKDLWNLAVKFRPGSMTAPGNGKGRFTFPAYQSVLQCPFCAKLACPLPDDEGDDYDAAAATQDGENPAYNRREKFVMVSQNIIQLSSCNFGVGNLVRLVCQDCFKSNIRKDNNPDWGTYEAAVSRFAINKFMGPIGAFDLSQLFETSGMCATVSKFVGEQMQNMGSSSSRKSYNTRLSKSRTKKNRGQYVIKMKPMHSCARCGIQHENNQACGSCQKVHYCSSACQRRHWKYHKPYCSKASNVVPPDTSKPSNQIIFDNKKKPYPHKCPKCDIYPGDSGTPAICMRCGVFISCGPCAGKTENGGNNANPIEIGVCCDSCQVIHDNDDADEIEKTVGHLLLDLLEKKPTGYHVPYVRLMLAQFMINKADLFTGIRYDPDTAMEEYLWLANNCDFAPAQYYLSCLYDPMMRGKVCYTSGPCPMYTCGGIKEPPRPPSRNAALARMYLERAVEQNFERAVMQMALHHNSGHGEFYPESDVLAMPYIQRAAALGNAQAMAMHGSAHIEKDELELAIPLYLQSAALGYYASMFFVIQLGLKEPNPEYFMLGRGYLLEVLKLKKFPPSMKHIPPMIKSWKKGYKFFEDMLKVSRIKNLTDSTEDTEKVKKELESMNFLSLDDDIAAMESNPNLSEPSFSRDPDFN